MPHVRKNGPNSYDLCGLSPAHLALITVAYQAGLVMSRVRPSLATDLMAAIERCATGDVPPEPGELPLVLTGPGGDYQHAWPEPAGDPLGAAYRDARGR